MNATEEAAYRARDPENGAEIAYMTRNFEPAPHDRADMRKVLWPDGSSAIEEWPQDSVPYDRAPHPEEEDER